MTFLRFVAAMWPGLLRILAWTTWTVAAVLAGVVIERERAVAQQITDARVWPWTAGTWSVDMKETP